MKDVDLDNEFKKIQEDHYFHWFILLSVAGYGWQLYGFWAGLLTLILQVVLISVSNTALLLRGVGLKYLGWSRWGWIIVIAIGLGLSKAEIVHGA